jgi:hypothetical protein
MPLARVSYAVISLERRTRPGLNVAAMAMFCGKIVLDV